MIAVDMAELLRYWGCRGTTDAALLEKAQQAAVIAQNAAQPRITYRDFELIASQNELHIADFTVSGNSLSRHLQGCDRVILLAATLGTEIDFQIKRAAASDMALSTAISAAGSALIESYLDLQCDLLSDRYGSITHRFSPGYGDLSLDMQCDFFRQLDITAKIGVTLTDALLMIPSKSVTAIIGIKEINTQ